MPKNLAVPNDNNQGVVETIDLKEHGTGLVLDHVLTETVLTQIDAFRTSLPLDNKRPTVDRRFFADTVDTTGPFFSSAVPPEDRALASILEQTIQSALLSTATTTSTSTTAATTGGSCHVFRYMRFLEYVKPGQGLDCHTDGTKICEETQKVSTHTLLLYLTDCKTGGETILRHDKQQHEHATIVRAVQPARGRILLFPHRAWHQGAPVVQVPKICLRCEVWLQM